MTAFILQNISFFGARHYTKDESHVVSLNLYDSPPRGGTC